MLRLLRTMLALSAVLALTGGMALLGTAPVGAVTVPQVTHSAPGNDATRLARGLADGARAVAGPGGSAVRGQPRRAGGSVVLGGSPGVPVANPKTSTVYVPVQCATSFCRPNTPGHVLDVINAATCNAKVTSGCGVVAEAAAGAFPLAAALDERTGTIYVADGAGTVTVVNGARCNANVTSGCARPLATIKTGGAPVAAAFNPSTRTVYVASLAGQVFVIDAARCNVATTSGCREPVKTVKDALAPAALDVDVATDTVYAANDGPTGNGDTVSVINGATCNGSTGTGCGQTPATVKVGANPFWDAVDQTTNTIYVTSYNDGTVSVINGATCNATATSGCAHTPPAVTTGAGASFAGLDPAAHTLFAVNQNDDTLSAINTRTCRGGMTAGCPQLLPAQRAAANQGPAYDPFPSSFALIPQLRSLYLVNIGGAGILSVLNPSGCDATHTAGCRRVAPSAPDGEFLTSIDPATDTIYAGNLSRPQIDVINGATCHAGDQSGCAPVAKIPTAGPFANLGAIDSATHTLYASDSSSGTVSVINTATCNATRTTGCAQPAPTITVGPNPGPPSLNPATRTLYVPYGNAANRVAVVNAAACNAQDPSGCGQAPAVAAVGQGTFTLAVSPATNTIYGPNAGSAASGFSNGDTVSMINGAACNATHHSGCGHLAAIIKVGLNPQGVAINDRTHTVYVANNALGDMPGTVSVINGATCNGSRTSGCAGHHPTVAVGRSPNSVAVDTRTGTVYVTDTSSAAVSVINGSTCNAGVTSGCGHPARLQAVGSQPFGVSVNQLTSSVYVTQLFQAGSMSVLQATGPRMAGLCGACRSRDRYDGHAEWYDSWNKPHAERNAPGVLDLLGPGAGVAASPGAGRNWRRKPSGHPFIASAGRIQEAIRDLGAATQFAISFQWMVTLDWPMKIKRRSA
jgi:DNA-binding beta-propeller fold protein YncE